ncbi:unnamed protein product [Adineta ricciae]|uniref:Uncharacterized protein n=1 Tax=Adineta ricciae TaxID=249248 RepID=A0A815GF85_ADIRI|nr:unnamed protein product [Adineta ricciae]CAF1338054.1 unnamed protein product [Adineta ricciae]
MDVDNLPMESLKLDKHDLSITTEKLSNGDEYTKVANHNAASRRRKLILHFDNRNTLEVANNVSATTIEQGVNNFLTGVLWGYEKDNGEWEWISTSPSLEKPAHCPHCITYFKYLENQIVKEAIDRKQLRAKTGSFVQNEGSRFRRFYDELIESLRYYELTHPERKREDEILASESQQDQAGEQPSNQSHTVSHENERPRRPSVLHKNLVPVNGYRSRNGTLYHYVLPSFFRLIQYLQDTDRDFVIYLRTMGDDSKNFLLNAQRILSNEHPAFQFHKSLDVNHEPGLISRTPDTIISLRMKFEEDDEMQVLEDEFLIEEKLANAHGIHAIKDDFGAWCRTNYHYTTSKPIWFDPDDRNPATHHILFDDNFRVIHPNDSIVDIRIMDQVRHKCYSCSFDFYPKLENVFAVQANLYLILADRDYYVKSVNECEQNLDRLLEDAQLLKEIKEKSLQNQN